MKEFASMIKKGMLQGASIEQKQVFRNMMTSILLNESVYMPVLHMMLPMQVNGNLMLTRMPGRNLLKRMRAGWCRGS